jgi:hypothetical protein
MMTPYLPYHDSAACGSQLVKLKEQGEVQFEGNVVLRDVHQQLLDAEGQLHLATLQLEEKGIETNSVRGGWPEQKKGMAIHLVHGASGKGNRRRGLKLTQRGRGSGNRSSSLRAHTPWWMGKVPNSALAVFESRWGAAMPWVESNNSRPRLRGPFLLQLSTEHIQCEVCIPQPAEANGAATC